MSCKYYMDNLGSYIDEDIESEKWNEIMNHISKCEVCRNEFEKHLELHNKLEKLFCEKEVPDDFASGVIKEVLNRKKRDNIVDKLFKKHGIRAAATFIGVLLTGIISLILIINNGLIGKNAANNWKLAPIICVEDKTYQESSLEIITDDKIINKEIGVVSIKLGGGEIPKSTKWSSTFVELGTKIYSIKGINQSEAIAVKYNGNWVICREISTQTPKYSIFTEDMLNAEKIVVESVSSENIKKEITDKEIIRKIALGLKEAEWITDRKYYNNSKNFVFYFIIRDSAGIGKIVNRYRLNFYDINFDGYISAIDQYKISPEVNRLIAQSFENTQSDYNKQLGGFQQVYAIDIVGPKIIIKKQIVKQNNSKFKVSLVKQGENLWKNGTLISDTLIGKYKIEIIMENTTVDQRVIDDLKKSYSNIPGAVSIELTQGITSDTTVMYIGFDTKIKYEFSEQGDTFLLLIK